MLFVVTYKCKEGHIHEAIFEPNNIDLIKYFSDKLNITLSEDQIKYMSIDKLSHDPQFKEWLYQYGSGIKQKEYDNNYIKSLEEASKELEKISSSDHIDTELTKLLHRYFLPTCAKTTLKRRFNKIQKEKGRD